MFRKLSIFPIMAIILSLFLTACEPTYELNLKADPDEGGRVSSSYGQGEEVTLLAEPEEGYEFEHWALKDGEILSTNSEHTLKIEQDREIKAVFSRKSYRVSLTSNIEDVSLSGAGSYEYGEVAEIKALEKNNFTFSMWIEEGEIISDKKNYRFEVKEDRELTARIELDIGLEDMILKDDLAGYLLPVRNERTTGLISPDGEKAVKKTKWIDFNLTFSGGGGAYTQPYLEVGETNPLVHYLNYEHAAVFNTEGRLITILPERKGLPYNDRGVISYEKGKYGFVDHNENLVLDYIYDDITIGQSGHDYLELKKDGKKGLFNCTNDKHIIDPEYSKISPAGNIEDNLFKAEKGGDVYLYDKNGEMILELDYDETWVYRSSLLAVRENGKWGFIDLSGEFVIEPAYDEVNVGFFNGFCMAKQDGKWGVIDTSGRFLIEPVADHPQKIIIVEGATQSEAVFSIDVNSKHLLLDSDGKILFEGKSIRPFGPLGNLFTYEKDGKIGLLSKEGEVIEEHIFEDLLLPGPMEYGGHEGRNVAENYAALKKEGQWAIFKDGAFLTDFKFEEIPGRYNRPMEYNGMVQIIVKEDRDKSAGLYDIKQDEYIIPQGEYDEIDYLREGRVLVKQNGKYGYVDRNNRPVTAIEYDNATAFENEAAAAIKDDRLIILDREGNNFVEPLEINPEDYTDNRSAHLQLTYLEGPEVYRTLDFSYFDQDGWIRKPD